MGLGRHFFQISSKDHATEVGISRRKWELGGPDYSHVSGRLAFRMGGRL